MGVRALNDTEREAIILNCAWEMIDGMVNRAIFEKTEQTVMSNLSFSDQPASPVVPYPARRLPLADARV
jgi:hypothetical protein